MNDDTVIERMRLAAAEGKSPVEVFEVLCSAREKKITDFEFITYFKRAFPSIPLRDLRDLEFWSRINTIGTISDDDVNSALSQWLVAGNDGSQV